GVTLEFPDGQGIAIQPSGVLSAIGSKDKHITLHGTHPGKWLGMLASSPDDGNRLQVVDLDRGGSGPWCWSFPRGIGHLELDGNAVISIEDSSFSNGANNGIHAMNGAVFKAFARNSFSKNHGNPLAVSGMQLPMIDPSCTFKGDNDDDEVYVRGGTSGD